MHPSFTWFRNMFSPHEEGLNSMAHFLYSIDSLIFRKSRKLLLALSWVSGLGFGGILFRYTGSDLVSLMPLAASGQPSITGLLISASLPFLFSAFAVYWNSLSMLYGICFLKALLIGYFSCGIFAAFGSAGWLVRCMLLFTDYFGAALLFHYCLRHISGPRVVSGVEFVGYSGLFFLAAGMDYSCISPFLRHLLS